MGAKENKERTFEVPKDFIGTFFNQMDESELDYTLSGLDYENDILFVDVEYSPDQRDEVMNLIESLIHLSPKTRKNPKQNKMKTKSKKKQNNLKLLQNALIFRGILELINELLYVEKSVYIRF